MRTPLLIHKCVHARTMAHFDPFLAIDGSIDSAANVLLEKDSYVGQRRRRRIFVIAHRCNGRDTLEAAMESGANAIECDVHYDTLAGIWFVDHDGAYPWSTTLHEWLGYINEISATATASAGAWPALINFDIKTPYVGETTAVRLLEKTRQLLLSHRTKILVEIAREVPSDTAMLLVRMARASERAGWTRDDVFFGVSAPLALARADVHDAMVHVGVDRIWLQDGTWEGGTESDSITPDVSIDTTLRRALARYGSNRLAGTYVWTLQMRSSIEHYLVEVGVSAVVVSISAVVHALDSVYTHRTILTLHDDT